MPISEIAAAVLRVGPASQLEPASIRELRRLLDLSQADAAELVDVAPNTWSRWERGEIAPTPLMAAHLADALQRVRHLQHRRLGNALAAGWSNRRLDPDELEQPGG